jgi:hydroxyethylthiazole kinase
VVVTGAEDVVTDGTRTAIVHGGDARMPMITALGCASTALVAACCAVGEDPFASAVAAMAMLAAAGERAGRRADGPGSLRVLLLDELAALAGDRLGAVRIDLA